MTLDQLTSDEQAHLECALWAETDPDCPDHTPLDKDRDATDFDDDAARDLLADWNLFKHTNARWIGDHEVEAAHDFWLSRNGHGAGFFDRTDIWPRRVCDLLQAAAHRFGQVTLFVNDAGSVDII